MFKTYLKIALRNLRRHKKITIINVTALTLGLVPVILILLFVQNELSFDRYHEKADRIYRVAKAWPFALFGKQTQPSLHSSALAPTMAVVLPEVISATRLWRGRNSEIERGENIFREENVIFADPEIFDIFSFELLRGDPKTALAEPQSIVISEDMVEKYFGDKDPMNRILTVMGHRVQVTGVLKHVPKRSHFLVDFLLPVNLIDHGELHGIKIDSNSWRFPRWFVYFLVREGTDITELEKAFPQFLKTNSPLKGDEIKYFFQPLTDIHFYSDLTPELGPKGDIKTVYLYLTIALILLLISCISYINLATVRSAERAREVGIRKVSGAHRWQLMMQFLGESTVLTLAAISIAVIISVAMLPAFSVFVEQELELSLLTESQFFLWFLGLIIVISVCTGSYPALVISAFKPVTILRSRLGGSKYSHFRTSLVVVQCVFSILFIIGTLVVRHQLQYFRELEVGNKAEQIVVINTDNSMRKNLDVIKTELNRQPTIMSVSAISARPNRVLVAASSKVKVPGQPISATIDMCRINIDYSYINFFGIELVEGRNFSRDRATDIGGAYILNETAVNALGWKPPVVGRELEGIRDRKGQVIGVVKDFQIEPLHYKIKPLLMYISPEDPYWCLCVKISTDDIATTIAEIKAVIANISPNASFNFRFYDEVFEEGYRVEQKLERIFSVFSGLAVLIACLGLAGLAALTTEQRRQEIGIRKVFGASAARISALLTKDFAKWVVIASVVAWPLAWYGANQWLQTFAYRVALDWALFVFASALLLAIVLLTVGYQAFRAASANPVQALRYE